MNIRERESLELSVIMPCYNEENTVGICVRDALAFMRENNICGEVVVVDNASTDISAQVATGAGARVVRECIQGYGKAIQTGITNSRGSVFIIGDCDTTYDFLHMEAMYQLLSEEKCDMVIGNRFAGKMEKGSMSFSHQWGVRFLSFLGRVCFHTDVYDFHCGLRGIRRDAVEQLDFRTTGMEFASEMIGEAVRNNLCIMQVPAVLRNCKYERKSKLRTVRDGIRHVVYILKNSIWF